MSLAELEADDAAIARLQVLDENNPLFRKARVSRRRYKQELDRRMDVSWPLAQHPFEYDPKKPSLHP